MRVLVFQQLNADLGISQHGCLFGIIKDLLSADHFLIEQNSKHITILPQSFARSSDICQIAFCNFCSISGCFFVIICRKAAQRRLSAGTTKISKGNSGYSQTKRFAMVKCRRTDGSGSPPDHHLFQIGTAGKGPGRYLFKGRRQFQLPQFTAAGKGLSANRYRSFIKTQCRKLYASHKSPFADLPNATRNADFSQAGTALKCIHADFLHTGRQ